jgi:hypothetical protein
MAGARSAVAIGSIFLCAPVLAATVIPIQGDVRVSTDQGFKKIDTPREVAPSTRVLVAVGSSATIAYSEDCRVEVRSMATVAQGTPCNETVAAASHFGVEQGTASSGDGDYGFTPRVGDRASPSSSSPYPSRPKDEKDNCVYDPHTLLVVAAVGGAIAGAVILLSGGSDKPASP